MSRHHVLVAIQGLVSIVLLAMLTRSLDLDALRTLFLRLPFWFYLGSLLIVVGGQVVYAWRWRLLLSAAGIRAPFSTVVRQYFIGIFLNNFLPSTIGGDVAKVYLLGRDHGYRAVTASVLLDRMLGLGLLAVCAMATLWSIPLSSPVLAAARLAVTGVAAASMVALGIAAVGTGGLPRRLTWLGPSVVSGAERIQRLRLEMVVPLTRPALIAKAAIVVVGYFAAIGAVYTIYIGLQRGAAPPFILTAGIAMAISLLSNIPVSLNGLGLREQLHVSLLLPIGVTREAAVGISLLLYGHLVVGSLVGFVFWLRAPAWRDAADAA